MTAVTTGNGLEPCGRFEWERLVRRADLPMRLKFVAVVVATFADADGSRVRPGVGVLADVTGQGESTVRRLMSALQEFGLLTQVARGGGRKGKGRATEYRLTVPADLYDRVPMLSPGERRLVAVPDSPLAQGSGQTEETPLAQESAQSDPQPVDNSDSPLAIESAQSDLLAPIDRSENTVSERLSARKSRLTARSSELLPSTSPTTKTTTTTPDPTPPPTARKPTADSDRCPVCREPHPFLAACRPRSPTGDPP